MLFNKEDFDEFDPVEDSSSASDKLEQIKSFARYVISNPNVIDTLGIELVTQNRLLDNLIYWHEKEELFEICQALITIKKTRSKAKKK